MNSRQLEKILMSDPLTRSSFLGVYPSDLLPKTDLTYPCSLVANTDPHYLPGAHWVSFYFSPSGKGEFFDSYGKPPGYYSHEFEDFITRNSLKNWTYNNTGLQGALSNVCGEYAALFIINRNKGMSLTGIVNMFSSNTTHNDRMVWRFFKRRFPGTLGTGRIKFNPKPMTQTSKKRHLNEH